MRFLILLIKIFNQFFPYLCVSNLCLNLKTWNFSILYVWNKYFLTVCAPFSWQQLEAEVNVHWSELVPTAGERPQVLPLMLYRLAMCLDVYTEALSSRLVENDSALPLSDSQHFAKEKIFFRTARWLLYRLTFCVFCSLWASRYKCRQVFSGIFRNVTIYVLKPNARSCFLNYYYILKLTRHSLR